MKTIKKCTALLVHNTSRQVNGFSCLGFFLLLLNIIHLFTIVLFIKYQGGDDNGCWLGREEYKEHKMRYKTHRHYPNARYGNQQYGGR